MEIRNSKVVENELTLSPRDLLSAAKLTMKIKLAFLVLLATLATAKMYASPFGIGVAFGGTSSGSALSPASKIMVPINIGTNFRLEPYVGYQSVDNGATDEDLFQIGTGVYFKHSLSVDVGIYYGASLGVVNFDDGVTDDTGFNIRPNLGLEYYFSDRFAIGADIGYTFFEVDTLEANGTDSFANLRIYF